MAKQVQIRRGTTTEHSNFTGAAGELTYNTTTKEIVVHDGTTVGGNPAVKKADLADPSGASLVGYMPAGVGANPTTVQAKLRNIVSVKDFGAVGDGITDDTTAIQNAINYAQANISPPGLLTPATGPGTVYFPQGAYVIIDELLVDYKVCILGDGQSEYSYGSRLIQTTANKHLFNLNPAGYGTSFSIEKMVLANNAGVGTGNLVNVVKSSNYVNSQRYVDCTFAQPQSLALCLTGDDISISNCLFDVSTQSGNCIQLGGTGANEKCSNVRIVGCDFFHIIGRLFHFVNVYGVSITGCNISQPNSATRSLIIFDAQASLVSAKNISISGNAIEGPRTLLAASGVENIAISGNTVHRAGVGAGETQSLFNLSGINTGVCVNSNAFSGAYDNINFWVDASATSVTGSIVGNTFLNQGGAGDCFTSTGLVFSGSVSSNYIQGFVNYQLSGKCLTTGNAITPGTIASLGVYNHVLYVIGAKVGDLVNITVAESSDFLAAGVTLKAQVMDINTVVLRYSNNSAGPIAVSAHDVAFTVTK